MPLRTDFRPSAALYPFSPQYFSPQGPERLRTHYLDVGEGQPLLMVHGNPTWSFLFRKMVPKLVDAGFRCVVPDLLGYGLSDHPNEGGAGPRQQSDMVRQLVEYLDLRELIIVGQDWGGPISLGAGVQVPDRVAGVAVGSTFAWRTSGIVRMVGRALRTGLVQRWMGRDRFVARVVRGLAQTDLSDEEIGHYTGVVGSPQLRRSLGRLPRDLIDADAWLEELERDVREKLGAKRALFLHGVREGVLGRQSLRRFDGMFDDCEVVRLPTAGHFFQEDSPDEATAALVRRFRVLDGDG